MELPCSLGIRALSCKENLSCFGVLSHIINPLLTKLVRSRWLDIGLVLFFLRVYRRTFSFTYIFCFCFCFQIKNYNFVSVHEHAEKELGQYSAILTSLLVNYPYISMQEDLSEL